MLTVGATTARVEVLLSSPKVTNDEPLVVITGASLVPVIMMVTGSMFDSPVALSVTCTS